MNIINPAEMRLISPWLAEKLAAIEPSRTPSTPATTRYCATAVVGGRNVSINPLLLTGLKQAAPSTDAKFRYWVSAEGKLLLLPDADVVAVDYLVAGDDLILNVQPRAPLEVEMINFLDIPSVARAWGQHTRIPVNEMVQTGINGHRRVFELSNGLSLISPNHHLMGSWQTSAYDDVGMTVTHYLAADLDENEFVLTTNISNPALHLTANQNQHWSTERSPLISDLMERMPERFTNAPEPLLNARYEGAKYLSINHQSTSHRFKQKSIADLWRNIEVFRLQQISEIMQPSRCDAWFRLLYSLLNVLQSMESTGRKEVQPQMLLLLKFIPATITECIHLIESSSLVESDNMARLDCLITRFVQSIPGLSTYIVQALENERDVKHQYIGAKHGLLV